MMLTPIVKILGLVSFRLFGCFDIFETYAVLTFAI
jgi:hypothetical protein